MLEWNEISRTDLYWNTLLGMESLVCDIFGKGRQLHQLMMSRSCTVYKSTFFLEGSAEAIEERKYILSSRLYQIAISSTCVVQVRSNYKLKRRS